MDELAVLNTSGFYICKTCGYGKLYDDQNDLVKEFKHNKSDGYPCSDTHLHPYALGHEFQTDVVLLKFVSENITDVNAAWTILYSLLEGLSKHLSVDRNELSGCLHWYRNEEFGGLGNFGFVLFDNTPGGAGYVRQLRSTDTFIGMLRDGLRVVNECTCGGEARDTACYSCLCNYYNQKQHDILQRRYAIEFFESMKNGTSKWRAMALPDDPPVVIDVSDKAVGVFANDGQNQSGMSFEEIWEYISQDTDDEDEQALFSEISSRMATGLFEKPYYNGSVKIPSESKTVCPDLIWPNSKAAFFLRENREDYCELCDTDWKCYCIEDQINLEEFLQRIKMGD